MCSTAIYITIGLSTSFMLFAIMYLTCTSYRNVLIDAMNDYRSYKKNPDREFKYKYMEMFIMAIVMPTILLTMFWPAALIITIMVGVVWVLFELTSVILPKILSKIMLVLNAIVETRKETK